MLEVFINFLCSLVMSIYGFYIIREITKIKTKITDKKSFILLLLLSIATTIINKVEYRATTSIIIFLLNIIIYKYIFKITFEKSLLVCGIMMILSVIGDLAVVFILRINHSINEIRNTWYIYLLSTIFITMISIGIFKISKINKIIDKFYKNIIKNEQLTNELFLIFVIIGLSQVSLKITKISNINKIYIGDVIIILILFSITLMFLHNKNKYNDLSFQYDSLFNYVQNFEEWIEKEQLNRHEYKNQLAVLRCLTKEKTVKDKIDEILADNINIEGTVVNELKHLPKGGIKGLMYYKTAIANKNKINITANVSLNSKSMLEKLPEYKVRVICKLIGIYFDNAIEAAKSTRKKEILIEIYEIKDHVSFVFSNTFKKSKNFENRNKKGVSSKGPGRGNGLYFAKKLISENPWIIEKQDIVDKYYIEQVNVYKKAITNK